MVENNLENDSENNDQETQNVTPKARKLTVGKALIIGGLTAYLGWAAYMFYNKPLIHLRPHVEQTVERTLRGVRIQREEYERFDKILPGKNINVNYDEGETLEDQPELQMFIYDRPGYEHYFDKGNDGTVEVFVADGSTFKREDNVESFQQTIDPRFAEYKQRLNVDQIVAEKMQEARPTIEQLLNK